MSRRWFIGLSSGSSLNGVDAALVRIEGVGPDLLPRLEHFVHEPFSRDVRDLLLRTVEPAPALQHLGVAHRVLGEAFANASRKVVELGKQTWQQILAIGLSGHTTWHDADGRYPSTLSLGMPAALAERTGLTVVSDFRSRDLLVGGQGFPLSSAIDARLFRDRAESRVLIHLGGVATVLWLAPAPNRNDARSGLQAVQEDSDPLKRFTASANVIGFQAAPCTLLLDGLMRLLTAGRESFDAGGKNAVQGRCLEPLVERWLAHPLFKRKPPRNVPRHDFGSAFVAQAVELVKQQGGNLHDLLCSATHFAARAIVQAVQRYLPAAPDRILVSGGGARNGLLWRLLEQQLAPAPMERIDRFGVAAEARKALAFAGLAALTVDGVPGNVPASTGASGPRLLGSFTPGAAGNWARCLAWMAGQTAHHRLAA
jgi:anhydro-N-acetylmuramic acid kinase